MENRFFSHGFFFFPRAFWVWWVRATTGEAGLCVSCTWDGAAVSVPPAVRDPVIRGLALFSAVVSVAPLAPYVAGARDDMDFRPTFCFRQISIT
jgi:hypothetical protein